MRSISRTLTRSLVATVSVAMGAVLLSAPPASATTSAADEPVVIVQSPVPVITADVGQITVTLDGSNLVVNNPGAATTLPEQCFSVSDVTSAVLTLGDTMCVGTSHNQTVGGAPTDEGKLVLHDADTLSRLGAYDWIVEEAIVALSSSHDVPDQSMIRMYARPEIRAYVHMRIRDILDRVLYGVPLTPRERGTYDAVIQALNTRETSHAKQTLAEYERWEADPCGYVPPAPPSSALKPVPNPVRTLPRCQRGSQLTTAFQIVNDVPPVETFETWARYRNPTPTMTVAADPSFKAMSVGTSAAYATLAGVGIAVAAGALAGVVTATVPGVAASVIAVTGVAAHAAAHATISTTAATAIGAGTAAGVVGIILVGAVMTGVSIWMVVDEQNRVRRIKRRAANAGSSDDPLGIEALKPIYADLDYETRETPADGSTPLHQSAEFSSTMQAMLADSMLFTAGGKVLVKDPVDGYDAASTPADKKFRVGGALRDSVALYSDETDTEGRKLSGHRVHFSRGWLMDDLYVTGSGYQGPTPKLSVRYLDHAGKHKQMSVVAHADDDGVLQRKFLLTDGTRSEVSDTWEYLSDGRTPRTATLVSQTPLLPELTVLPSVVGDMLPGRTLTFQANRSRPSEVMSGRYSWRIERFDADGEVAQTWTRTEAENLSGFQQRFDTVGSYRATASFRGNDGTAYDVAGSVDFTIVAPEPEIMTASLKDDRTLDGKLLLDLRLTQDVPNDTFDVEVEWADDLSGKPLVKSYTVVCRRLNATACETDPLNAGPPTAPTNANWSESPSFRIPDDYDFLPHVTVRITNSHGREVTRVFPIVGDHRPRFVDPAPYVQIPVGTFTRTRVVEVTPATTYPDQRLTIRPYVEALTRQLPPGLQMELVQDEGRTYLEVFGKPESADLGLYTLAVPVDQEPEGAGVRATPARVTLDLRPNVEPGYRAYLTNVAWGVHAHRTDWPSYLVDVTFQGEQWGEQPPATADLKVMCELRLHGSVVFSKECAAGKPFPWPKERRFGDYDAKVWAVGPRATGAPYEAKVRATFIQPEFTRVGPAKPTALTERLSLELYDPKAASIGAWIETPYSAHGYKVTCRVDGAGAYRPCFDKGTFDVPHTPGDRKVEVRIADPDGAVLADTFTWRVTPAAAKLSVAGLSGPRLAGRTVPVTASGLLPAESYQVRIGGVLAATGKADARGRVARSVVVPRSVAEGSRALTVTGAHARRTGSTSVTVVKAKKLRVTVGTKKVRRGATQVVRIKGLVKGEKVVVRYRGKVVSRKSLRADARGAVVVRFKVRAGKGREVVKVRGAFTVRKGSAGFTVR
ncbi:hypothetical protein [Mumia quercus]|uniref:hypothetical protein n=1 Tax=Mumia quercus TaxID=2976125 RepID=UPI0021D2EA5C|nr:hypothetical protein [Mumia quercus]